jgi:quinol monooxygenase YgiN
MYLVTVKFDIDPEQLRAFMPLMLKQAEDSLNKEPNCKQFDVSHHEDMPSLIYLYEIYQSKADFSAHLETAHFATFSAAIKDMVLHKEVECFETISALCQS